jgi:hypothetical protein
MHLVRNIKKIDFENILFRGEYFNVLYLNIIYLKERAGDKNSTKDNQGGETFHHRRKNIISTIDRQLRILRDLRRKGNISYSQEVTKCV